MTGRQPGRVLGHPVGLGLGALEAIRRPARLGLCLGQRVVLPLGGLGDRLLLPFQRLDPLAGVAVQAALALGVAAVLLDPGGELGDLGLGPVLALVERVAGDEVALQDRCRDGLFLAQRRHRGVGRLARLRRLRGFGLRPAGGHGRLAQPGLGGLAFGLGPVPAAQQQRALCGAQGGADLAIALGLTGLLGKARQLPAQAFQHVLDPLQVGLGRLQLQLRLVAALVEARDPRGLLEDPPPRLGLGVDQLGDLALPDQRRRMRAGRGVGEQHLHVAGAHVLAVDAIGAAGVAGDPADDLEGVVLVEPSRRQPVGVVEVQRHLGIVPGGARRGAGEDHVLHAAAAHRRGAVLAHHPAQRLEQVGLAAAVRPDHAGQPRRDHQFRRVDEALEAQEPEFVELHLLDYRFLFGTSIRPMSIRVKKYHRI